MATAGYARPEMLAETEWLAEHIDNPNVRIVDTDTRDAYRRAHIPGAVTYRGHHYLKEEEGALHIMGPEKFAGVMGELGIGDNTLVIAYDGFGALYATRLWWALNYYGHMQVKVLNGGWNKWLAEEMPISNAVSRPPNTTFTPHIHEEFMAQWDDVRTSIGQGNRVLLDVRSDAEWTGENARGTKRGGRIPGAVHLEWLNYITDDDRRTFKPAVELRAMFDKMGATPEKEIITY
jgi:thiosulfate/3-mercaptopyruvate sulfurtransferase